MHADSVLPLENTLGAVEEACWGFFHLGLSGRKTIFRLIEKGINFRSRIFKVATGDQCLFFDREYFFEQGGFPSQPLMEDIEISRRCRKTYKPVIIPLPVITSSRRWEAQGAIYTVISMWGIQLLYKMGVPAERLAHWYCKS